MGILVVLTLFALFQVKHLIVDFFIQNRFPYMWMNKHLVWHPGGWLHAGGHGLSSMLVFYLVRPDTDWLGIAAGISLAETYIHFGIDWSKMNFGKRTGWKCNTSPYFWDLLGVDQFLHQMTYLWMVYEWIKLVG
jgi:hypothetical protein